MAAVIPGRYTAAVEGEFVVFLIGMRFNKFWKVDKRLPVAMAKGPMLTALVKDPSRGWAQVVFRCLLCRRHLGRV